jgi:hypothetical protein
MFRVVWLRTAMDELARAWTSADAALRQAITVSTHTVDHLLQTDPASQGESRKHGHRVLFEPPLGVAFAVRANARLVRVLHVWIIRRRKLQ